MSRSEDVDYKGTSDTLIGIMLPVSHTDLLVILACTVAITVAGFAWMGFVAYRIETESRKGLAELQRMTKAVAGLVYQEEEKTRALLREHGAS